MLAIKAFRKLWIALSLSSFGDWLGFLAQTTLAESLEHGNSYLARNFSVGLVVFVRLLPAATLAPLAGAFADRFDRRHTMVVADCCRFALYISIPIVGTLWWLFAATFLIETMSLFWIPAKEATVPNLVSRDQLEDANTLSLLTTYGSAPVAGLVFYLLSTLTTGLAKAFSFFTTNQVDLALYFDASTFLVSAATVFTLHEISHRPRGRPAGRSDVTRTAVASSPFSTAPAYGSADGGAAAGADGSDVETEGRESVLRAIGEGWRFIGETPVVRGLVAGLLGAFAAAGAVVGLAKIYVLDLGGGSPGYAALFASIFIGLAGGMFLGPRLLRGLSRRRLFGVTIAISGLVLALTAAIRSLPLVVFGTVVMGAFSGVAWVTGYTLFGLEVDDAKRGRTWATLQSMMQIELLVMVAAGPFISGAIGQHSFRIGQAVWRADGPAVTLFGAGVLAFVVGIVAYNQMDDRDVPLWRDLFAALRGRHPLTGRGVRTGLFVVFEGGEGAGKSTQAELLVQWLAARGYEVVSTREPGATRIGGWLRELLLDPRNAGLSPRAEALLYAADRAEHVAAVIRPALARGAVVVSDRYVDSSLAYQGVGRALSVDEIERLSRFATSGLKPDLTVLLDLPVDDGLRRAQARTGDADRLEQESAVFHERVRTAFRELADASPQRYVVVDASLEPAVIHRMIVRRLEDLLSTMSPDALPTVPVRLTEQARS